ncbi:MAG: hypothetical protein ACR2IV_01980 [Bryobacteraceae bacterium]
MPLLELSAAEVGYLAKMNGEAIFVMDKMTERKKGLSFADLEIAKQIQAKFTAVLPGEVPDLFEDLPVGGVRKRERVKPRASVMKRR